MVEKIKSIEDLEAAKAAAQAQGSSVPNYQEWSQILKDLDEAGVQSTGNYAGDKAKLQEIERTIEEFMQQVQEERKVQQQHEQMKDSGVKKEKDNTETDKNQTIKATLANGTSSMIMADYMKYYHLLS